MNKKRLFLCVVMVFLGCSSQNKSVHVPVNLSHTLNLTDSLTVNGQSLYFIHIYADSPTYEPVVAPGEGITCVDDVGRFLEVLESEIIQNKRKDFLPIAAGMTRFLLYMSREDGLWYNFMFQDGTINTTYRTSTAEFQWWAVRGLRGLTAAYKIFWDKPGYSELYIQVKDRIETMDSHLQDVLSLYPETEETPFGKRPLWLIKNAPDMSAELMMVLVRLTDTGNYDYREEIDKIAEGLTGYQYINPDSEIHGMYFCWQSLWHNWGNTQAAALMAAYRLTENPAYLESVRLWADHFVPFLIAHEFPWEINLLPDHTYKLTSYPQIAYGINSIYQGIKSLAEVTGDKKYKELSEEVFEWFTGKNSAGSHMYDPKTGRCYDGIDDEGSINYNSGAESTIECLMAIQKLRDSSPYPAP